MFGEPRANHVDVRRVVEIVDDVRRKDLLRVDELDAVVWIQDAGQPERLDRPIDDTLTVQR